MELTENGSLLETIFNSAFNGIILMKCSHNAAGKVVDFEIILANAQVSDWLGNGDFKARRFSEVFPAAIGEGILDKFITVAETGRPINFEHHLKNDNLEYWIRFMVVKESDTLIVTTEDVTEQKQAELTLRNALDTAERQRRLYDSITNNTPDLVYVFALDYRFTYANRALLAMWGKTADEAIGYGLRENGYEEWHAQMHEREIDEIIATKKSIRGTVSFPHAEFGRRIYDYILVPVLNEDGEVEAIAGTTRDITDIKNFEEKLQQSEMRVRNMINQTPAPTLVLMGDDLVIEQINSSMLKMIGFDEKVIGTPLLKLMPELANQYIWEQVMKVYTEGTPFDQWEVLVTHKRTGEMKDYYYNIAYRPLREEGKIIGMIQVAIDVTEQVTARKKLEASESSYKTLSESLEQQVAERTSELQRSNEDLQQFAHVASHDLKEPVRKIKTFTNRLEQHLDGKLDDQARKFMERIHVATDRMNSMIEGVLAYSTTNAIRQQTDTVDLNEVIENIETDLEIVLQKNNGVIKHDILPVLEGAKVLLYQLFYNLINNSIKFAKAGTAPVIAITSEKKEDVGTVIIRVEDNGIGFRTEHAARIFETFTRLNPKDDYEGTGLGLSLCKKIAERHGGSIEAIGSAEGAVFILTLPLRQTQTGNLV